MSLGGNIDLIGFCDLDGGSIVILRKLVGNYVRGLHKTAQTVEKLTLTLNPINGEKMGKYKIHGELVANGTHYTSEAADFNMFFAVDKVLSKIQNSVYK